MNWPFPPLTEFTRIYVEVLCVTSIPGRVSIVRWHVRLSHGVLFLVPSSLRSGVFGTVVYSGVQFPICHVKKRIQRTNHEKVHMKWHKVRTKISENYLKGRTRLGTESDSETEYGESPLERRLLRVSLQGSLDTPKCCDDCTPPNPQVRSCVKELLLHPWVEKWSGSGLQKRFLRQFPK